METENFNLDTVQVTENFSSSNVEDKSQDDSGSIRKESIFHVLSKIYAQLLTTVAVIAVFTEILHGPIPLFYIHVYFYFYLLGGSILIFVSSFLSSLIHKLNRGKVHLEMWEKNNNHLNLTRYFMFGLVVCSAAAFTCTFLKSLAAIMSRTCMKSTGSVLYVLHSAFIILQVPFLFHAKKFHVTFGCFHKIGVMHLVATNVALWLYMLLWESSKDWQEMLHVKHNSSLSWSHKDINITLHSLESNIKSLNQSDHFPKHIVHVTSNCWWRIIPDNEISPDILSIQVCLQNSTIGMIWNKMSEHLYPFNVQYYLIVLFLLHVMWKNLALRCKRQCSLVSVKTHTKHCFCVSKGFYLGFIYLLASIIIITLYFVLGIPNFDVVIMTMLSIIFASAIFAVLVGLCQMDSVMTDIKSLNQSSLYFQEVGMCFVYVYGSSNLLLGCLSEEKYNLLLVFEALLMILHAVSQYIFIQSVIKSRQVINFLILCNVSLWILESFLLFYKMPQIQLKIFGIAWPVLNRIIIPCLAFYRFHSAVIFLNMSKFLSFECH